MGIARSEGIEMDEKSYLGQLSRSEGYTPLLIVSLPVIIEPVIELDIVSVMEEEGADEVATEFTVIAIRPVSPITVTTRMIIVPVRI
jgi:hypothetical protein